MIDLDHLDALYADSTSDPLAAGHHDYVDHNIRWVVALHAAWPAISEELRRLRELEAAVEGLRKMLFGPDTPPWIPKDTP